MRDRGQTPAYYMQCLPLRKQGGMLKSVPGCFPVFINIQLILKKL